MKRLVTATLLLIVASFAHAETVLICHAQSVPVSLGTTFRSPLSSAVVEGVFDYFFSKGDIAFDTAFSLADGVPSSSWLSSLSDRYGADKVVYVQLLWKEGRDGTAVLDRVDYQVVGPRALVIREGSFTVDLTTGTREENQQVKVVTDRVLAGLAS